MNKLAVLGPNPAWQKTLFFRELRFGEVNRSSRMAAVSGVYQYDTGQRLRMNGLPSPDELLAGDDLLSGDLVTVQAHFGYEGDEQTDMRLAQWDDDRWCWMTDIPDEYLTRIEPVHVFVYASHGSSDSETRAKTMYEGVFTPISRPAPNNVVSEDQLRRWETLEAEVDLALVAANAAKDNALSKVEETNTAAQDAAQAAKDAQDAAKAADSAENKLSAVDERWSNMAASQGTGGSAGVEFYDDTALRFTLPKGEAGAKGPTGDTGPADIAFDFSEDGILTITPK